MAIKWDWSQADPGTVTLSNTPDQGDTAVFANAQRPAEPQTLTADMIYHVLGKTPDQPYSTEGRQEAADANTRYGGAHMVQQTRPKGAYGKMWRQDFRNLEKGGLNGLFMRGDVWLDEHGDVYSAYPLFQSQNNRLMDLMHRLTPQELDDVQALYGPGGQYNVEDQARRWLDVQSPTWEERAKSTDEWRRQYEVQKPKGFGIQRESYEATPGAPEQYYLGGAPGGEEREADQPMQRMQPGAVDPRFELDLDRPRLTPQMTSPIHPAGEKKRQVPAPDSKERHDPQSEYYWPWPWWGRQDDPQRFKHPSEGGDPGVYWQWWGPPRST